MKDLHHNIKLSNGYRFDLKMWSLFPKQSNCISFFLDEETTQSWNLKFYTDATPTGCGGTNMECGFMVNLIKTWFLQVVKPQ